MLDSVFPGDTMTLTGTVECTSTATPPAAAGPRSTSPCVWADGVPACTTASLRIALPTSADDNPWRRAGDQWRP